MIRTRKMMYKFRLNGSKTGLIAIYSDTGSFRTQKEIELEYSVLTAHQRSIMACLMTLRGGEYHTQLYLDRIKEEKAKKQKNGNVGYFGKYQ